jgi:hypothetical protein
MARTDNDSWDITESVGATARHAGATNLPDTEGPTPQSVFVDGMRAG